MDHIGNKKNKPGIIALRISMIYALAGGLWILFSDTLLSLFISDPVTLKHLQTLKGWAFIAVTAFLLYVLVSRYVSAMKCSESIIDYQGKPCGPGTAFDITDRKKAEEALRESEERYRIIAETASDVIITIDQESIIQFANPASEKVFGYSPAVLVGQNITVLMPEHLRKAHINALKAYVSTGEKKMKWSSIELPGLHKSGKDVPLEISYGEFMKEDSHFFTGIIRDITGRREAARDKEYRDMLERFNQELESLVAERTMNLLAMTLADRVRNPASVIGATANRVLRKAEYSEKTIEHIRLIVSEAEKLDNTVKDFQNMLKNRQALFHYEDVCGIVRDVLPVIEQEAAKKQIDLTVDLPDRPLKINTERNSLKMAFFIILKNAVQLTPDEGEISVLVAGDENRVQVVVSDNGYGIPKEDIDAVFDPSSRVYGQRFVMGLHLIKQIISEHMGEMTVKSEIGQGTAVSMVFPVRWSGVSPKPDSART